MKEHIRHLDSILNRLTIELTIRENKYEDQTTKWKNIDEKIYFGEKMEELNYIIQDLEMNTEKLEKWIEK